MVQMCAGCKGPILDRFLLNVLDRPWHVKCVQCCHCKSRLSEKCFSRDGKLFCKADFFRTYGTKCAGCSLGILPSDLVRRARNKVFHLNCFTCMVCRKQLSTGEELYVVDENQFICKDDYISKTYAKGPVPDIMDSYGGLTPCDTSLTGSQDDGSTGDISGSEDLMDADMPEPSPAPSNPLTDDGERTKETNNNDSGIKIERDRDSEGGTGGSTGGVSGAKRRGPRTTIKAKQLETLKAAFAATPKPTRHIREQLAQETGLNMRVIQVWFQNRRSKERRMKQLSALGARRHHFFRNPRRMRPLRGPYDVENNPDVMGSPPFNYDHDGAPGDYYPQGYYDFFPGHQPPPDHQGEPLAYMGTPVSQHNPLTSLEQPLHPNMGGLPPEGAQQFGIPHKELSPSPEPPMSIGHSGDGYRQGDSRFIVTRAGLPQGGPLNGYGRGVTQELVGEVW